MAFNDESVNLTRTTDLDGGAALEAAEEDTKA
jgi:hypothetical protein